MPKVRKADEARKAAGGNPASCGTHIMEIVFAKTDAKGVYKLKYEVAEGEEEGDSIWERFDLDNNISKGILLVRMKVLGVETVRTGMDEEFEDDAPIGLFAEVDVVEKNGYRNIKAVRRVSVDVVDGILERRRLAEAEQPVAAGGGESVEPDDDVPF